MTKFIRLKTTAGSDLLLRTKWISSICGCPEKSFTRVELYNAIDHDDAYDVVQTVDEIQAMMQGEPEDKAVAVTELQGSIADQLRSLLGKTPLTLTNVAKAAQISTHTLVGFFNELHTLNSSNCERLAEALGHKITLVPEAKEST